MPAFDTVAGAVTTAGQSYAAATPATGDSFTVRNFPDVAQAHLLGILYHGSAARQGFRVRSPLMHDNVQGLRFVPGEVPTSILVPRVNGQRLYPQDVLVVELSTAPSTGAAGIALQIFYDQLPGASSRLAHWGDIKGLIKSEKTLLVAAGVGTANTWQDVVITTSENLLHANTDYAVLGYTIDQPGVAVGIKGIDTGNLRVCGPATTTTHITAEYFVRLSEESTYPTIPVFNSANAGSTFATVINYAAFGTAPNIVFYLAELTGRFGG
jgi:hypothetical protein